MSGLKNPSLSHVVDCLNQVPGPRSRRGVSHPFPTILAVIFLGLIANVNTSAEIARWAKEHFKTLKTFLTFGTIKGKARAPCDHTLTWVWRKLSYDHLQHAFAMFGPLTSLKFQPPTASGALGVFSPCRNKFRIAGGSSL